MYERPADIDDTDLAAVLLSQWGLAAEELRHLPVGFGGHHWLAVNPAGSRWFVTVNDVGAAGTADLTATMETAAWLAAQACLDFVVPPVRTLAGPPVATLAPRYAVTLFSYAEGEPGSFGDAMDPAVRSAVTGLLAELHSVRPDGAARAGATVPIRPPELAGRDGLDKAMRELDSRWLGGPYAEPARALLAEHAPALGAAVARFDVLLDRISRAAQPLVITHGEPHAGNLLRAGQRWRLVDWDTVGLAVPERDLWWVVTDEGQQAARYAKLTGRPVSKDALAFYRLRWSLDDISLFVAELRAPHRRTADTEVSWSGLCSTLAALPSRQ